MERITKMKEISLIQKPLSECIHIPVVKDYVTTITILENISDAIFILSQDGRIEYVNRSALEILRIEQKEIIGRFIDEIIIDMGDFERNESPTNKRSTVRNNKLIEKLYNGVFGDITTSLVNDEHIIPVILNFNVINDNNGKVCYIIVSAKDISYRKVLEKELKQQQSLSISRDRLKAIGALSIGLMHEFGQPLSALKLKLEVMVSRIHKNGASNHPKHSVDKTRQKLKEMLELVDKMSGILQNIRMFAYQTEDETISIVCIQDVIKNACKLVSFELKKRNINLVLKAGKQLPFIIANPLLIEQVFVNLLTNARDAYDEMDQKSDHQKKWKKEIRITTKVFRGKWIEITVEDNAGGIDEKIIDEIFEPFFTTKEPGANSGVGLSITKSIITSIGGDIKVTIKEKVGTKFILRIPINEEDEKAQLFNLIEMLHQS